MLTPQEESWWDDAANGWTQTAGQYQVFVGDSSALADLPLRGSFSMPARPGARQVTVSAPSAMQAGPGRRGAGDADARRVTPTLHGVRLALQLPQGWKAVPAGPTVFGSVDARPGPGRHVPGDAAALRARTLGAVVHATATTGGLAARGRGERHGLGLGR